MKMMNTDPPMASKIDPPIGFAIDPPGGFRIDPPSGIVLMGDPPMMY